MIIVMRAGASLPQIDGVREHVERLGVRSHVARDGFRTIIACLGESDALTESNVATLPEGESATRWRRPYRLASRQLSPPGATTVVRMSDGAGAGVGRPALA